MTIDPYLTEHPSRRVSQVELLTMKDSLWKKRTDIALVLRENLNDGTIKLVIHGAGSRRGIFFFPNWTVA